MLLVLKKGSKGHYRSVPKCHDYQLPRIYTHIKNKDIQFQNCNEVDVILAAIKKVTQPLELLKTDSQLLNRIIRNGGFCEYIRKLEGLNDFTEVPKLQHTL